MSIKDLFGRSTNYVSDTNQKDAFSDAESSRNVKAISEKQNTFEPQIDYNDPLSFARFGSAELYYQGAIDRIIDFYPYDGSDAEYNEFYNKSLDIEKFIFNNLYPRTTGYVNFSTSSISLKGGPHTISSATTKGLFKDPKSSQRETANIYDEDIYTTAGLPTDYGDGTRESNLKCDFEKGVTIEFWLKNDELPANQQQAIFHLTNSAGGDELSIFLDGTVSSGSPFKVTLSASHTSVFANQVVGVAPTKTTIADWNHYAVSFKSASAGITTKFYLNGVLDETKNLGSAGANTLTQPETLAFIASGSSNEAEEYSFLSGAMDEFRFWKVERTAQDIGRNWFGQVRGGTNTDINNTTLGVYYKFNEGITGVEATDKIVLDYSGRISNGTFAGYSTSTRNTGSAIVSASAATSEYHDPIIYSTHPDVSSLKTDLLNKGIDHDLRNNAAFSTFMPSWITEEHEERGNTNFKYLSHIVGSYFDKLYLQIEAVSTFKSPLYTSSSYKAIPFAKHMPASLGLETPEIFVDANVLEKFLNRNETKEFTNDLTEVRNLIYLNLYNNLAYLFKSKGTEKAVRNVLRAFNVDDKLVRFNTYANNYVYELDNNLKHTIVKKSSVNFNNKDHLGAVVYSSGSQDSTQLGYILGSGLDVHELHYGMTHEVDVIFPKFVRIIDNFTRNFKRVSLFGIHSASIDLPGTTVLDPSIYVYAQRDENYSKNIKFFLSSSLLPDANPTISSSLYLGAYDDENWNLSVRLKPSTLDANGLFGTGSTTYTVELAGYNERLGEIRNSFKVTGTVDTTETETFLKGAKRIFVGAHRTNVTGALLHQSDVLVSATRFWTKYLDDESLKQHTFDFENYGIVSASQHLSPIDPDNNKTLNRHTLALNYEFGNVTSADGSGEFTVTDISSGSSDARGGVYGKLGEISGYLYPGIGVNFEANATDAVLKQEVNAHQFINPELAISDNLIEIRTDDDKLFDSVDTIPNYHHVLEKSMYNAISEEMLNFFAGVNDFHNLIGHPVHQYRMSYKGLEKLRESFFRRVTDVTEVERFVDYYKWFDDAISQIIGQLIPASAEYTPDILNTIESHVLERAKFQHRIPITAFTSSTEGVIFGAEELRYNWGKNHAPVSGLERDNSNWWRDRAEREGTISSGDSTIDKQRDQIRNVGTNITNGGTGQVFRTNGQKYAPSNFKYRTLSRGQIFESKRVRAIKGGVNFEDNKDIHYTYTALHPDGPINRDNNVFVPRNVLLGFTDDLVALQDTTDPLETPSSKVRRNILVQHGRDWEGGIGYKSVKSAFAFPFNIISSSVVSGYNAEVVDRVTASIEITNLHNDVYGPDMERPMQGTFTEYAVGGHQSRHVSLNQGSDDYLTRPEAWKLALGLCTGTSGAIGMLGADYPWPEANEPGVRPYPLTGAQKAVYFRDELAKRPVNIRNIEHKTGSTILGNYNANYDVVHTVGGYSNPRAFIDEQPAIPPKAAGADVIRTLLDYDRGQNSHFTFIDDYNAGYLTGSGDYKNKTVIRSRFSAPGSIETMTRAFTDFRSGDFSVYNSIPFRNMTVRRPFQGVTSSMGSETTGIRNYDHTGRAFGFTNLAARHSARFFRDSYVESDTDFANVPRNTPDLTSPGKADDAFTEAPSFHKIHRNNVIKPREVISTVEIPTALNLTNTDAAYLSGASGGGDSFANHDSGTPATLLTATRADGFTYSGWMQFSTARNTQGVFSIGHTVQGQPFLYLFKGVQSGQPALFLWMSTRDGATTATGKWYGIDAALGDGNFHHVSLAMDNSLTTAGIKFYVDGQALTTVQVSAPQSGFETTASNSNFRGFGSTDGDRFYTLGDKSSGNGAASMTGAIDQVSIWTTQLGASEVSSLYNSGNPYNITASSVYTDNSTKLHAWWTFETSVSDVVDPTNPGSYNASTNKVSDFSGNDYHLFAWARSGQTTDIEIKSSGDPVPVAGDSSTTSVEVVSYVCDQKYDNLNLQHQIPQSDRQYSWFAHSVVHTATCEPRRVGFMQVNSATAPYYEVTGNYYPFFDYVSASAATSGIYQNTTRLDLLVHDKTGSAINTLGEATISGALQTPAEAERLNALLIHRGDTYGWNWRAFRQQDHPILNREHKENLLTAVKDTTIKQFNLPPVSLRGRPVVVNMDIDGENISLKTTHNNEKIYFNDRELNDLVFQMEDPTLTPFDQLMEVSQQQGTNLNWVHYSETLFPSTRNEFLSSSRERVGYDNKFWKGTHLERLMTSAPGNANSLNQIPINDNIPDRSIWPLDQPLFTSSAVTFFNRVTSNGTYNYSLKGAAGELQNNDLFNYINDTNETKLGETRLSLLYSRKQDITSPNSVVSPSGFAKLGSLSNSFTDEIQLYGGEAAWEAGTNATINIKSGSFFISSSYPSEPWFDEYGDFREELQLVARDYAIIPEFRISEHIREYVKGGTFNKFNFDTFEIPGTTFSSSQQNFYKDYSNSDFLREFASIKDKSGLSAKEIMLTCKAAVRFNPYKGFYPAQRTTDLVSQFSSSFAKGMNVVTFNDSGIARFNFAEAEVSAKAGASAFRPLIQPLFAPGILYNSIKSGIAVDYPVVTRDLKILKQNYSDGGSASNWCLAPSGANVVLAAVGTPATTPGYVPNFQYWDLRVPFETIVEPGKYIDKINFIDFEPHPSASINATASLDSSVSDGIYELMAKNFFGQTGDFFLKDSSYSKIESDLIQDGLKFKNGDVFSARLKIRKSHNGKRFYNNEYGFNGTNDFFTDTGARAFNGTVASYTEISGGSFPLPQDPAHNTDFEETFTMYSRPTAFGPSVVGRPSASYTDAHLSGTMDSINGFNWAYTPPYYHGESWVDFVFRPEADKTYTLEDILTETETVYWRVDPGAPTGSVDSGSINAYINQNLLIQNGRTTDHAGFLTTEEQIPIYGGSVINKNAMQLDSSLNLFGVKRIPKKRKDKFGNLILDENELAGKRWVIQPKWETPMLNFANVSENNGNITYPTNFSESVPRGMWHQFGQIPTDPNVGVFLEIGDIPKTWLQNHYQVLTLSSSYNNNEPSTSGSTAYLDHQSLTDLFGFQRAKKKDSINVRLGEIADKREVYEAVVAIPYILEPNENYENIKDDNNKNSKKFINIPKQRFRAALKERETSKDGDSLQAAGESIRKMVQKMKRYVLPPQFDFINFDEIDPIVMYFFEFKYEFDKDDLSYIWQNLAPRDYKKITFQEAQVAHDLMNNELLDEENLMNNPNLRWMVFKVKQKAKKDYYDLIAPQIKDARPASRLDKDETDKDDEYLQFNWPYDYLSFVELVKLEADVLYKAEDEDTE